MDETTTSIRNRVAIVTGGASGIGLAVCERLARAGFCVAVADLNGERVAKTVETLRAASPEARLLALAADVRREPDMTDMARRVLEQFGRIDVLVHSAGILRPPGSAMKILPDLTPAEWDAVVDTNLKGTFLANRAVLPAMIRQKEGQIVNISSTSGRVGRAFDSAYCASKFGVIGLTESLAGEVRQYGVRVFAVLPDAVDTPIWSQNGPIPAPEGSLPPDRVAAVIEYLVNLPPDTTMENVVITPFRSRKRRMKT
jgi:NAD(P)-dependent dehydrogenase (short-subunit alcohol dehydrogenase family)